MLKPVNFVVVFCHRIKFLAAAVIKTLLPLLCISIMSQQVMAEKINFNTADSAALQSIPGIGESKAQSIIEYREQIGGFKTNEQLMEVSGVGQNILNQIIQYGDVNPEAVQDEQHSPKSGG